MQILHEQAPTMMGMVLGPDKKVLRLNQKEIAALERAIKIREEARDRLREAMGVEAFESSDLYVLPIDDLVEAPNIVIEYDYSRVG